MLDKAEICLSGAKGRGVCLVEFECLNDQLLPKSETSMNVP
jgi:hypothetical protein